MRMLVMPDSVSAWAALAAYCTVSSATLAVGTRGHSKWTCVSHRPGTRYEPRRSMTRAFAVGAGSRASRTSVMRLPSIVTLAPSITRGWTQSIRRAPVRTVFMEGMPGAESAPGVGDLRARLGADNRDERDTLARRAAEVVRQRELAATTDRRDLPLAGLAAQLRPRFEQHAQAGRADRVAERLQAAVGIHGELAVEIERPGEHFLP